MNANDVIESYVTDVAVRLPRRQRNDVAFELRALLVEGLHDRAADAGRDADAAMAIDFVRAFGRPADVAARYRPPVTIIDPQDSRTFAWATAIGLALVWCEGLVASFRLPLDGLGALGHWWTTAVIPSLWWPGVLVVGFGAAAWARRRWPDASAWTPRAADRIPGGRISLVLGVIGIVCGLAVLVEPRRLLDLAFGGLAAPAAYQALTYTETFRHRQAPVLLGMLLLYLPIFVTVIVRGRWSPLLRRLERWLASAVCAAMVWTVLDGPVFMATGSDTLLKTMLVAIGGIVLIGAAVKRVRRVRPGPDAQIGLRHSV